MRYKLQKMHYKKIILLMPQSWATLVAFTQAKAYIMKHWCIITRHCKFIKKCLGKIIRVMQRLYIGLEMYSLTKAKARLIRLWNAIKMYCKFIKPDSGRITLIMPQLWIKLAAYTKVKAHMMTPRSITKRHCKYFIKPSIKIIHSYHWLFTTWVI